MSLNIKVGPKIVKDTFYTLIPVNWVLRIFVLSNVKKQQNKLIQCWSLTENLIVLSTMLAINIFFLWNKVQRFEGHINSESIKFTDSLQLTYLHGFMEYILDLVYIYKARHTYLKYLNLYASIDRILGVPNFSRIRSKNMTVTASLIISFLISSSLDYTCWLMGYGWISPTLYALDYIYIFINALSVLDVVSQVIQIEYRLKVVMRWIEDCYSSSLSVIGPEVLNEVFDSVPIEEKRVGQLRIMSNNKYFGILSLSKCYVLLIEQVNYINTAYGFRIGAFCLNLLINLIHLTNIVLRISLGLLATPYPVYHLPAAFTMLRIINYAAVLYNLVYRCEKTYRECAGIVRLIDLSMVNKKIPNDLRAALLELRTLVLTRPIKFHGANFFTLDYPLLVSVVSVVGTYTIILLQSMK